MKNEKLLLRRVDILLLMMRDEFPSQLCFQRVSGWSFTARGEGRGHHSHQSPWLIAAVWLAYLTRMPAWHSIGWPIQGRGPPEDMTTPEKIAHKRRRLQSPFNQQSCVSLLFHHSCHCYYVIFLTRPSRLREQHCFPADSPAVCVMFAARAAAFVRPSLFLSHVHYVL